MTTADDLRRRVLNAVDALPEPELCQVADYLDQLRQRSPQPPGAIPHYRPLALGSYEAD